MFFFSKKRKTSSPFFNAGFKIRTVDRWKPVAFEKKIGQENSNIGKKTEIGGNERKMFTYKTVNSDHIKLLFNIKDKHDKWLVKYNSKTLQTLRRRRHSSIKTHYSEILLSVVSWDCDTLSVTHMFCCSDRHFQNYKNAPRLCHSCYTQIPWVAFSVVVWRIYKLRFT